MKKYIKIIIIFLLIILCVLMIYYINDYNNSESKYFYNKYKSVSEISKDNVYERISAKETIDFIKNKTGIIYFGYNTCPWCQNLVPLLDKAAKENNVKHIYYIDDFYSMRPDKNDNPKYQDEYEKIVKLLGSDIVEMKTDDNPYDIIRVPLVLFVKNGEIVDYHKGTLENHVLKEKKENGKVVKYLPNLTSNQKKELLKILNKKINSIYDDICIDTSC